jgi:3-hydroxyisobutyrate dehydrogenase-like beta-hydroxyacid dehydrogenase
MKQRVAVVGVGLMGGWFARHLLAAGYSVLAHDVDPAKVDAIVQAGGIKASSPDQIASQVDVILLSLPNSQVVDDVVRNTLKLFESGRKGLVVLDASTADPQMSKALAAELAAAGMDMLDSTVSGTSEMAAVKDTVFMVGGKPQVYEACLPLFRAMGREWVHMGANGNGATIKLIVNLVLSLNRMALAEGLTLAKKAGLDQLQTLEVLKQSAAGSKCMDQKGDRMVQQNFLPPIGTLATHYKDVRLMLQLGAQLDCPLPLLSLNVQALASEISKGRGHWDSSDIIMFYNGLCGWDNNAG